MANCRCGAHIACTHCMHTHASHASPQTHPAAAGLHLERLVAPAHGRRVLALLERDQRQVAQQRGLEPVGRVHLLLLLKIARRLNQPQQVGVPAGAAQRAQARMHACAWWLLGGMEAAAAVLQVARCAATACLPAAARVTARSQHADSACAPVACVGVLLGLEQRIALVLEAGRERPALLPVQVLPVALALKAQQQHLKLDSLVGAEPGRRVGAALRHTVMRQYIISACQRMCVRGGPAGARAPASSQPSHMQRPQAQHTQARPMQRRTWYAYLGWQTALATSPGTISLSAISSPSGSSPHPVSASTAPAAAAAAAAALPDAASSASPPPLPAAGSSTKLPLPPLLPAAPPAVPPAARLS